MALRDILEFLACPHCGKPLSAAAATLRCPAGHAFDVARQGYVSLRQPSAKPATGDTAAMVMARETFLASGRYDTFAAAVAQQAAQALAEGPPGCVADVGAGTGFYLARVLDGLPDRAGIAVDVSPAALRRAARAHPRAGAVGGDAWAGLPLRAGTVALLLSVFAPRNPSEFQRVLHPAGALLVVTPTATHLRELVTALDLLGVDPRKSQRLAASVGDRFTCQEATVHEQNLTIGHDEVVALATMGPSAWHHDADDLRRRVAGLPDPVQVTVSVALTTYRPAPEHRPTRR